MFSSPADIVASMGEREERRKAFAAWLRDVLGRRDLDQAEFLRMLQRSEPKISSGLVSRWYNAVTLPSYENVRRIAEVLGIEPDVALAHAGYREHDREAAMFLKDPLTSWFAGHAGSFTPDEERAIITVAETYLRHKRTQ